MTNATPPNAAGRGAHVIDQRVDDDGSVLVTFALPALRTATVRVPWAIYLQGEHIAIGHQLAGAIALERARAGRTPPAASD